MSLLAIVYQSLLVFAGLFVIILTVSYVSYKIKQKSNPTPLRESVHELQPVFAGKSKPNIPRNPYLNQDLNSQFVSNNARKIEKSRSKDIGNTHKLARYTKIDVLYEDTSNETETQNYGRHSSGYYSQKTRVAHYDDFPKRKHEHSLDGYDILNYYDEENGQQFYPFRTKF